MNGFIRTRFDIERGIWLWWAATDAEAKAAKDAGVPVHKMFGEQPSEFERFLGGAR
jgi:hypothetical protein